MWVLKYLVSLLPVWIYLTHCKQLDKTFVLLTV